MVVHSYKCRKKWLSKHGARAVDASKLELGVAVGVVGRFGLCQVSMRKASLNRLQKGSSACAASLGCLDSNMAWASSAGADAQDVDHCVVNVVVVSGCGTYKATAVREVKVEW